MNNSEWARREKNSNYEGPGFKKMLAGLTSLATNFFSKNSKAEVQIPESKSQLPETFYNDAYNLQRPVSTPTSKYVEGKGRTPGKNFLDTDPKFQQQMKTLNSQNQSRAEETQNIKQIQDDFTNHLKDKNTPLYYGHILHAIKDFIIQQRLEKDCETLVKALESYSVLLDDGKSQFVVKTDVTVGRAIIYLELHDSAGNMEIAGSVLNVSF